MNAFLPKTQQIRDIFSALLQEKQFTSVNREGSMTSLVGNTTLEIVGAAFIADEQAIFGEVNWDYVHREEEWYYSQSLNVNDIPGGAPKIWQAVADKDGFINSNYGAVLFSDWNYNQYENCLHELKNNPGSRRATAIYNRPSMWNDYNFNGRSDFICTNAVGYVIRNGQLHAHVQMRSSDGWAGYRNDRAWQMHILQKIARELDVLAGNLYWTATSLHIYARNYYLIDHYSKTGEISISKEDYCNRYPDSEYI